MAAIHRSAKTAKNVYRGYMPIDLPQHRPPNRIKPWWKVEGKPRVTVYPKQEIEGYSEEPEYPPLNDGSRKGCKTQIRLDWYETLKSIPTIEQKMHEIGRHCDHYVAHINNWLPSYNSVNLAQYLTQTKLIFSLPDSYKTSQVPVSTDGSTEQGPGHNPNEILLEKVKQVVLEQIALDKYESIKKSPSFVARPARDGNRSAHISNRFVQNIVTNVKRLIALDINPELSSYQYDLSPTIRSWWYHSGFEPPNKKIFFKSRQDQEGRINQMVQINGSSALNIRSNNMLEPIISTNDPLVTDISLVKSFSHPLANYGAQFRFSKPVALPGFWYGEIPSFDFPHTCFLSTDALEIRNAKKHKMVKPLDDYEECMNSQAILTAFGWLNSLSMYHGFTPFNEIDYPLTCQVVTTDGKYWLFNVYQLNCHTFHRDLGGPQRNNLCWTSGRIQLYDSYKDGNFVGVNDEVIELLVRFLSQKTSESYTSEQNLRPFLGVDKRSEDEKESERIELRKFIEQRRQRYWNHMWRVPLFEKIFYRSKEGRHKITGDKPQWHPPKPLPPKIFE